MDHPAFCFALEPVGSPEPAADGKSTLYHCAGVIDTTPPVKPGTYRLLVRPFWKNKYYYYYGTNDDGI